jgi:diacylglycerol kinase
MSIGEKFMVALRGIKKVYMTELSFRIHVAIAVILIIVNFMIGMSGLEWIIVILVLGSVMAAEIFNTAVEDMMDVYSRKYDDKIKDIKDISAGAVLLLTIISVIIGLIIYVPKVMSLFY